MCGISGFNWQDEGAARRMVAALKHRGPDAEGVYTDAHVSLGHNRLSIIDLSAAANQPMQAGEHTIVFNGEIYNYRELKKELADYPFKTESDTEVILAGYKKWGKGVVERLNGIFAFAIWDSRSNELFCARDHAGQNPFYYFWDGKRFIFGSELKAIFAHDMPRKLNQEAFNHYLRVLYVPEPMTMVQNIYKLPPCSTLTLQGTTLRVQAYKAWEAPPAPKSYTQAKQQLRDTVVEAVGRQLVADVPVGVYLSGGIDSSVVLAAAKMHKPDIEAYSIGFALEEGEERDKFNSDLEIAERTAKALGVKHHPIIVSAKDIAHSLEEVAAVCDDPVSNPTAVPMLLLARAAKKSVSVVLTGSGGDELFGGYDRYRYALAADWFAKLPKALRTLGHVDPQLRKLDKTRLELFAQFMFQKDKLLSRVIAPSVLAKESAVLPYYERYVQGGSVPEALMHADLVSWLPEYFFMLSDKMSMRSALEARVPLLDRKVVALASTLPCHYKVGPFATKKILKDAFRSDLPDFLFNQPKRGWFSPGAKWLRRPEVAALARRVFAPDFYPGTNALFDHEALQEVLERHIDKREYNLTLLWALLTFNLWARHHKITV